ncbi:MAG: DUF177 domain-containing protein [Sphingomonadales bacterium]|nr:DUF177 domain-containing protein [Sphingomonadales bacterium]MDE2171622.1 DUF177 domain-containing protein [Sphingomonadales bacterium]
MTDTPHPEFSRIIDIRHLDAKPITLTASAEEAKALAKRFDLVAVHSLAASVAVTADDTSFRVTGRLTADIVQSCAISGEDLPVIIDEPLNLRFVPASEIPAEPSDEEIEITEEDCDEIEFSGERFDLGEAVAQSLGLAIDPFAEGPEAERVRREVGLSDEGASGPFAALAALKKQ